jgi:SAM-dependent methyltransferase
MTRTRFITQNTRIDCGTQEHDWHDSLAGKLAFHRLAYRPVNLSLRRPAALTQRPRTIRPANSTLPTATVRHRKYVIISSKGRKYMTSAKFVTRDTCINCGSGNLRELSGGLFNQEPLHGFLSNDPWGESPVPYLDGQRWSYVQCTACNQAFHGRTLSPEWNEINFSRWMSAEAIAEFERTHTDINGPFNKAIHSTKHVLQLASLIEARPLRVLDFGCGNGEFLAMCHQYGFEAFGVDRSSARRDKAGVSVVPSVDELDGRPFHAITLFEVLEHVDDPRGILTMLRERLVPGGILVLETPDCSGIESIQSFHDYECIHPLQHINGFTPATLRSIAERVGFESIRKPVSHVTASQTKAAKTEVKRVLGFALRPTTQQYFRLRA